MKYSNVSYRKPIIKIIFWSLLGIFTFIYPMYLTNAYNDRLFWFSSIFEIGLAFLALRLPLKIIFFRWLTGLVAIMAPNIEGWIFHDQILWSAMTVFLCTGLLIIQYDNLHALMEKRNRKIRDYDETDRSMKGDY
jgi:hypothetical protein